MNRWFHLASVIPMPFLAALNVTNAKQLAATVLGQMRLQKS